MKLFVSIQYSNNKYAQLMLAQYPICFLSVFKRYQYSQNGKPAGRKLDKIQTKSRARKSIAHARLVKSKPLEKPLARNRGQQRAQPVPLTPLKSQWIMKLENSVASMTAKSKASTQQYWSDKTRGRRRHLMHRVST